MHTEHHRHAHHHGCAGQGHGPEMFYGYCHDTGRMRMMNYPDYVSNVQTGLSNMYQGVAGAAPHMQPMMDAMTGWMRGAGAPWQASHGRHGDCGCHEHHWRDHDCGCGCHEHGRHHHDCHHEHHCHCCIRCADVVEYARCGEIRRIPITFDNDTRRERDVTLQLGGFATESGQQIGWQSSLSETAFKLPPCGEKIVVLSVTVDCSKFQPAPPAGTTTNVPPPAETQGGATVDSCKVAYATLRAEGCTIRPLVIAVAVLPEFCGAHEANCGCGCCH
jgi:hypothetical protein